jgi:hypothetical protein
MGSGGKPNKCVPVRSPLGRYGAFFVHRGQDLLKVAAIGPKVEASSPEELEQATAEALAKDAKDKPRN